MFVIRRQFRTTPEIWYFKSDRGMNGLWTKYLDEAKRFHTRVDAGRKLENYVHISEHGASELWIVQV